MIGIFNSKPKPSCLAFLTPNSSHHAWHFLTQTQAIMLGILNPQTQAIMLGILNPKPSHHAWHFKQLFAYNSCLSIV